MAPFLRLLATLAALAWLGPLAGCGSLPQNLGPAPELPSDAAVEALRSSSADHTVNQAYAQAANDAARSKVRNGFVVDRLALVDAAFQGYLRSLSNNRRRLDSGTEGAVLGLSIAGTLKDSARAKEGLAAAVAAITGLKSNVDKNWFDNRGLDAMVTMMVARRKEILVRIVQGLAETDAAYPLPMARRDLEEYWFAGTLDGAFVTIQTDAAGRDVNATTKLDRMKLVRNVSEDLGREVIDRKRAMTRSLGSPAVTLATVRGTLLAAGVPGGDIPATHDEALKLLADLVRAVRTQAEIDKLFGAFQSSGMPIAQ